MDKDAFFAKVDYRKFMIYTLMQTAFHKKAD